MAVLSSRPEGAIDVVARLLATENITLIRSDVSTASFDIKNRVLTLPTWKEMNVAEELMLVLHETAHALFTSLDDYEVVFTEMKHLIGYANIIEDVRIEKLMKERYQGSRKQFSEGYKSLNNRDFFGVNTHDLDNLLLIDKINLYYKVGRLCGVSFDKTEEQFVMRAERVNTIPEVIELAKDIYAFSKQKQEQEKKEIQEQLASEAIAGEESSNGEEDTEYDMNTGNSSYDSDEDSDEDSGDESDTKADGNPQGGAGSEDSSSEDTTADKGLESITEKAYQSQIEQLADTNLKIRYFEPTANNNVFEHVLVSYKECIEDIKQQIAAEVNAFGVPNQHRSFVVQHNKKIDKFKTENNPFINYLVKEFDMRKSATEYSKAKIAKIGQLDMKKIYAYKLKEDLFKQVMSKPEGKNHGMIFLLDWSGSMSGMMENTVEQVIALAKFCQRIQIPFQVFAFTDSYMEAKMRLGKMRKGENLIPNEKDTNGFHVSQFHLLELFSHRMKLSEFNFMQDALLSNVYHYAKYWGLGGTPLNEALLFMTDYVGEFKRMHNVEKLSFITLTDGEGCTLFGKEKILNGKAFWGDTKIHKSILRDSVTGRQYSISEFSRDQTTTFLQIIKDRHNVNTVGFFVIPTASRGIIRRFLMQNSNTSANNAYTLADTLAIKLRKERAAVLKNFGARDEMYIIIGSNKIEQHEIHANGNMSATQLSKELSKTMNTKKHSRVVLDRFLNVVC